MKTYGQKAADYYVFPTHLSVDCDLPDLVEISTHIGHDALLNPQDVEDLIMQLLEWLFTNLTGEEK